MRVAPLVALLLLSSPHPARADDSREAELRASVTLEPAMPGKLQWGLFGQLVGDATRSQHESNEDGEVAIGAELALASDMCRLVVVGGQARLFATPTSLGRSGEQWASACLISGNGLPLVELGHHLELQLRPALSAPRYTRAGRYNRERITSRFVGLDYRQDDLEVALASFTTTVEVMWPPAGAEELDLIRMNVDGAMFRWLRPGRGRAGEARVIDVIPIETSVTVAGADATTMRVGALRLEQLRLPHLPLYLDADAAWAHGSLWQRDENDRAELAVAADTVASRVALTMGGPRLAGGLGYARTLEPTVDLELVAEDRVTAWATFTSRARELTVDSFVASSLVLSAESRERATTGGAHARLRQHLGHELYAGIDGEVARSYYAVLDGAVPRPRWAARLTVSLTGAIGNDK